MTIAGDIDPAKTRELIAGYFGPIPGGAPVVYHKLDEPPITKPIIDTFYDANTQLPLYAVAYRVPGRNTRDAKVLQLISNLLSAGGSSRLSKKMVDEKKDALQVVAFSQSLEDYGAYIIGALPNNGATAATLLKDIDEEVVKLQTDLISEEDYQKLENQVENIFVNANSRQLGIAEALANGYTFYHKDTNEINEELGVYRSITREEIRDVAKKYLDANQRLTLYYLPGKGKAK